jgi:thioredoxin 1
MIREVRSPEEWRTVEGLIGEGWRVIVVFTAPWCKPCEAVYEVVEGLLEPGRVEGLLAFKVNVQELQEVALSYRVLSVPTVLVFNRGRLRLRVSGVPGEDQLLKALQ